jgi:predicted phage terminase large subunit-like protein
MVLPRHMQVWAWVAQQIEKYRWVVVVAPTGYAKTTFFSIVLPSWEIGADPSLRYGLISNSAGQAYENSKAVQQTVLQPIYRATYGPGVAPAYDWGWAQDKWYVRGGHGPPTPTMLAMGMDGPILGRRLDRIVVDDPTTQEQARSRTVMQEQRKKLRTTIITRFPPGQRPPQNEPWMRSRMVVVCTRWGTRDLVPELEQLGFTVITMPALGYWDATKDPVTGRWVWGEEPLWNEVETHESLVRLRDTNGALFELVWQGDARAGEGGTTFDPMNFQRGTCPYQDMGSVTSWVDTSSGRERERGDYFAMVTVGENKTLDMPGSQVWIINVNRERYTAPEQVRQVELEAERMARMGCPVDSVWIATTNEGGAKLYQLLSASTRLPLREGGEREDKEFRATALAAAYKNRYVWHDTAQWNNAYEAELELFPGSDHDDQVDAAAGAYNSMTDQGVNLRVLRSQRGQGGSATRRMYGRATRS